MTVNAPELLRQEPLGASTNTILYGNAINQELIDIKDMDQENDTVTP